MSEHKSLIIYKNWRPLVAFLDDKSAGQLFKGLFAFACDGECTDFGDTALSGIYQTMIQVIAEDDEKYKQRCKTNSENGKLGGRPPKETESFPEKPNESERFSEKPNVTQKNPIGEDRSGYDRLGEVTDKSGYGLDTNRTGYGLDKKGHDMGKENEKGSGEKKEGNPENDIFTDDLSHEQIVQGYKEKKMQKLKEISEV